MCCRTTLASSKGPTKEALEVALHALPRLSCKTGKWSRKPQIKFDSRLLLLFLQPLNTWRPARRPLKYLYVLCNTICDAKLKHAFSHIVTPFSLLTVLKICWLNHFFYSKTFQRFISGIFFSALISAQVVLFVPYKIFLEHEKKR